MAIANIGFLSDPHHLEGDVDRLALIVSARADLITAGAEVIIQLGDICHPKKFSTGGANAIAATKGDNVVPTYFVLGNHECDPDSEQTKASLLALIDTGQTSFRMVYDIPDKNVRLVLMDACFTKVGGNYYPYPENYAAITDPWFTPEDLVWLDEQLQAADDAGKYSVVMSHHPLGRATQTIPNRIIVNYEEARDIIASHKVVAVVCGHEHAGQCGPVDRNSVGSPILYLEVRGIQRITPAGRGQLLVIEDDSGLPSVTPIGDATMIKVVGKVWTGAGGVNSNYDTPGNWLDEAAPDGREWVQFRPAYNNPCSLNVNNSSSLTSASVLDVRPGYTANITVTESAFYVQGINIPAGARLTSSTGKLICVGFFGYGILGGEGTISGNLILRLRNPYTRHFWDFTGDYSATGNIRTLVEGTGRSPALSEVVEIDVPVNTPNAIWTGAGTTAFGWTAIFNKRVTIKQLIARLDLDAKEMNLSFLGGLSTPGYNVVVGSPTKTGVTNLVFGPGVVHNFGGLNRDALSSVVHSVSLGGRVILSNNVTLAGISTMFGSSIISLALGKTLDGTSATLPAGASVGAHVHQGIVSNLALPAASPLYRFGSTADVNNGLGVIQCPSPISGAGLAMAA